MVTQASRNLLLQLETFVYDYDVEVDSKDDAKRRVLYLMRYGSKRLLRATKRRERMLKKECRLLLRGAANEAFVCVANEDLACVATSPDEPAEVSESASYCGDSRVTAPSRDEIAAHTPPTSVPASPPMVSQPEAIPEPQHGMLVVFLFAYVVVVFVSKVAHDVFFDS